MRVALVRWVGGWIGAVALVAACSGASNPLGGKDKQASTPVDGGGSGGSSSGGSSGGSSSSGGGATTCTNGSTCNDGSTMKVCTSTSDTGACASITYSVDSASFTCDGCTDCAFAQSQASQACAEAGGSSSSGSSTSSGSSGSSSGSSTSSGSSGSSSGSSSGAVDAGNGDATCQAEAAATCVSCCQNLHMTGLDTLIADIQACDCGTSGVCQTACATEYCSDGTITSSGDACDTCLEASIDPDGGACVAALQSECTSNADCLAYITCTNGCPAQ